MLMATSAPSPGNGPRLLTQRCGGAAALSFEWVLHLLDVACERGSTAVGRILLYVAMKPPPSRAPHVPTGGACSPSAFTRTPGAPPESVIGRLANHGCCR